MNQNEEEPDLKREEDSLSGSPRSQLSSTTHENHSVAYNLGEDGIAWSGERNRAVKGPSFEALGDREVEEGAAKRRFGEERDMLDAGKDISDDGGKVAGTEASGLDFASHEGRADSATASSSISATSSFSPFGLVTPDLSSPSLSQTDIHFNLLRSDHQSSHKGHLGLLHHSDIADQPSSSSQLSSAERKGDEVEDGTDHSSDIWPSDTPPLLPSALELETIEWTRMDAMEEEANEARLEEIIADVKNANAIPSSSFSSSFSSSTPASSFPLLLSSPSSPLNTGTASPPRKRRSPLPQTEAILVATNHTISSPSNRIGLQSSPAPSGLSSLSQHHPELLSSHYISRLPFSSAQRPSPPSSSSTPDHPQRYNSSLHPQNHRPFSSFLQGSAQDPTPSNAVQHSAVAQHEEGSTKRSPLLRTSPTHSPSPLMSSSSSSMLSGHLINQRYAHPYLANLHNQTSSSSVESANLSSNSLLSHSGPHSWHPSRDHIETMEPHHSSPSLLTYLVGENQTGESSSLLPPSSSLLADNSKRPLVQLSPPIPSHGNTQRRYEVPLSLAQLFHRSPHASYSSIMVDQTQTSFLASSSVHTSSLLPTGQEDHDFQVTSANDPLHSAPDPSSFQGNPLDLELRNIDAQLQTVKEGTDQPFSTSVSPRSFSHSSPRYSPHSSPHSPHFPHSLPSSPLSSPSSLSASSSAKFLPRVRLAADAPRISKIRLPSTQLSLVPYIITQYAPEMSVSGASSSNGPLPHTTSTNPNHGTNVKTYHLIFHILARAAPEDGHLQEENFFDDDEGSSPLLDDHPTSLPPPDILAEDPPLALMEARVIAWEVENVSLRQLKQKGLLSSPQPSAVLPLSPSSASSASSYLNQPQNPVSPQASLQGDFDPNIVVANPDMMLSDSTTLDSSLFPALHPSDEAKHRKPSTRSATRGGFHHKEDHGATASSSNRTSHQSSVSASAYKYLWTTHLRSRADAGESREMKVVFASSPFSFSLPLASTLSASNTSSHHTSTVPQASKSSYASKPSHTSESSLNRPPLAHHQRILVDFPSCGKTIQFGIIDTSSQRLLALSSPQAWMRNLTESQIKNIQLDALLYCSVDDSESQRLNILQRLCLRPGLKNASFPSFQLLSAALAFKALSIEHGHFLQFFHAPSLPPFGPSSSSFQRSFDESI